MPRRPKTLSHQRSQAQAGGRERRHDCVTHSFLLTLNIPQVSSQQGPETACNASFLSVIIALTVWKLLSGVDSGYWTFMKELIGHAAWFLSWCKPSGVAKLDGTMPGGWLEHSSTSQLVTDLTHREFVTSAAESGHTFILSSRSWLSHETI